MALFNVGDVVQLKSGGPIMTVNAYSANGQHVICKWFEGTEQKEGTFAEASVQAPPKPGPSVRYAKTSKGF